MNRIIAILCCVFLLCLTACNLNHVFEKNTEIPDYKWDYKFIPQFKITIDDTVAFYNLSINIRHLDAYRYMNMWVIIHSSSPDGKQQTERVSLSLAKPDGKWIGEGLNGVWMASIIAKKKIRFMHKGEYTFALEHDMRINPLEEIMNVGIKLEKLR
jgi:gliding motility-associated lipoprotein GldH